MNDLAHGQEVITVGRPSMPESEATQIQRIAEGFAVTNDETAEMAAEELRGVIAKKKLIEDERTKITRPINEAVKAVNALFKKLSAPLDAAESVYKRKLLGYQQEQERRRREEQAKAEEAARLERERLEREAEKLEKKGKVEEAAAKREVAEMMPLSMPAASAPRVEGFSTRKNWKGRCTDKRALIVFVAAHPDYDYLLEVNEQKSNALAKQHECADLGVPGLEGFNDAVAAIR